MLALVILPATARPLLRAAGRMLVAEDPLERADVIVVAVDADGAGVLEASDLVRRGFAARVAVFSDPPGAVDREFLRRGIPYYDAAARAIRQLHALGIVSAGEIERPVSGTTAEGALLPGWCSSHGYRTVIFVSLSDHSRRTRRVLRRDLQGSGVTVLVHYSRYSEFDPDGWWLSRQGARSGIVELEKLLADVLRHPFS
ncbi:MAG TPA: hypothetical protein VMB48_15720 [Steroidobacteraceae bacterium]|nr:hypothetical protein [Steroidobacteraceae bacterium]